MSTEVTRWIEVHKHNIKDICMGKEKQRQKKYIYYEQLLASLSVAYSWCIDEFCYLFNTFFVFVKELKNV